MSVKEIERPKLRMEGEAARTVEREIICAEMSPYRLKIFNEVRLWKPLKSSIV
jgi:hypothetical protein